MIPTTIDADAVAAIAALDDPVLRNLWITQAYAEFSRRLCAVLDRQGDGADLTWCGFAVWASATAGRTIRKEDLRDLAAEVLGRSHRHRTNLASANQRLPEAAGSGGRASGGSSHLATHDVVKLFDEALDTASRRVADGNQLVFAELGPLFVAFIELLERSSAPVDDAAIEAALAAAAPGEIAADLLAAFVWYGRAASAQDPSERARAILAGNVIAVAHEQRRLQDDIRASMDAGRQPLDDLVDDVLGDLGLGAVVRWLLRIRLPFGLRWPSWIARGWSAARHEVVRLLDDAWDDIVTAVLMTLRVPGAELRLAEALPPLDADGTRFPPALAELVGPPDATPSVAEVYGGWDRTGGTGLHDGARDWGVLADRMNYIVNLFRSRQRAATLASPPFNDEQLAAMRELRMPDPPLLPP